MKKTMRFILLSMMTVVLLFASSSLSSAAEEIYPVEINVQYGQTEARTIFDMINNLRANDAWYWNETNTQKVTMSNLQPLTYDYKLEKVAMQRAAEIAISYGHTRPDNTTCFTAYDGEFYYGWNGENIAAGYRTARDVNIGWEEADELYSGQGHRRNMLSENFRSVGIGHVRYNGYDYWVEEFSSVRTNTPDSGADDAMRNCTVNVAQINIKSVLFDNQETYNPAYKQYIDNFKVSAKVRLNNSWPGSYCPIANAVDVEIADSSIAHIEGDKLYGDAVGTTDITFSCLGKSSVSTIKVVCQHEYKLANRIEPDCENRGRVIRVCTFCGDTNIEVISALGHTVVIDSAVEPTCTETGLTEGSHCEVCGTVFVPQYVISEKGHSVVIDSAVKSTCTETGLTEGSHCEVCGTVFVPQYVIPEREHYVVIDEAVEPTCTKTGLTEGSHCEVCGTVFVP
ncbi:MAG: CAP domain-containing protein, partial [Ruminococcus sp.]|nr:CAP domain-containing protein [Ruminococcus sp.]